MHNISLREAARGPAFEQLLDRLNRNYPIEQHVRLDDLGTGFEFPRPFTLQDSVLIRSFFAWTMPRLPVHPGYEVKYR